MRLIVLFLSFISCTAFSQNIEMVSLGGVGGATDTVSRFIANHIAQTTPYKLIVVSKTGAQHNIAYKYFVDCQGPCFILTGNTILTNQTMAPIGYPRKIRAIAQPVHFLGFTPLVVLVKKQYDSFEEFIRYAKVNEIKFGHSGQGTAGYEGMEYICSFIPKCFSIQYKNGSDIMRDMSVGIIDVYVTPSVVMGSVIGNPKIHPIFLIGSKIPGIDLRTNSELKINKMGDENWLILFHNGLVDEKILQSIQNSLETLSVDLYQKFPMVKKKVDVDRFWTQELIKQK